LGSAWFLWLGQRLPFSISVVLSLPLGRRNPWPNIPHSHPHLQKPKACRPVLLLSLKLLFRKKSTAAAVLALALLVAVVASMTAIVNFVDAQASSFGQLARVGSRFLAVERDSVSLNDSQIRPQVLNTLNSGDFRYICPQKLLSASLESAQGTFSAGLRGIGNLSDYMQVQSVSVNGSYAKNSGECNAGVLLAKTAGLSAGDYVNVTVSGHLVSLKLAGISNSNSQLDTELLVPLETTEAFSDENLSLIEFNTKSGVNTQDVLSRLSASLPPEVQIVKVQQTVAFLQSSTGEIHNFLTVWASAVYVLVAASSYVVCVRLIVESEYELDMLKALGAKRRGVFGTVFVYAVLAALAGGVVGVSLGVVGTQVASSGLRWLWPDVYVTPFLDFVQAGQIIGLSVMFGVLGCLYPAWKATRGRV
jgi:putative ABC transport system permease protein